MEFDCCRELIDKFEKKSEKCLTFSCYDILNAIANTEFFYIFLTATESLLFFTEIILMQKKGSQSVQKAKAFSCFQALLTF